MSDQQPDLEEDLEELDGMCMNITSKSSNFSRSFVPISMNALVTIGVALGLDDCFDNNDDYCVDCDYCCRSQNLIAISTVAESPPSILCPISPRVLVERG